MRFREDLVRLSRRPVLALVATALALMGTTAAQAQNHSFVWGRRHNQGTNLNETARASTMDTSGNFYVVGEANGTILTAKYDSSGAKVWSARFSTSGDSANGASAVVVDSSGNVYVSGYSFDGAQDDALLIKYNASGSLVWSRTWDGPAGLDDVALDVALDGSGNPYIVGRATNASVDAMAVKYSAAGSLQWERTYDYSGGLDQANAVAVDSSGNVVVVGYGTTGATQQQLFLVYSSAGSSAIATSPGGGELYDVATRGTKAAATGRNSDMVAIAYWSGGSVTSATYNGSATGNDAGLSVAFDNSDRVAITGYLYTANGRDIAVLRFAWLGTTPAIAVAYNGPTSGEDVGGYITTDSGGNLYVSGVTTNGSNRFITTLKYTSAGAFSWAKTFGSAGSPRDAASGIGVDSGGNVLVGGQAYNNTITGDDLAIGKYNSAGTVVFETALQEAPPSEEYAASFAVNRSTGESYVAGTTDGVGGQDILLVKVSAAGASEWSRTYNGAGSSNDSASAVAVDASGNVFVAGTARGSSNNDIVLLKYNSAGTLLWARTYDGGAGDDAATAVAVDSAGAAIVVGRTYASLANGWDYVVRKYDSAGNVAWTQTYNGSGSGFDEATAVTTDAANEVYVTGYAWNGSNEDVVTLRISAAGTVAWTRVYNGGDVDAGWAITVSSAGNVYVAGQSYVASDDILALRYSSAGTLAWSGTHNGGGSDYDAGLAIEADSAGNAYVAGYVWNSATDFDMATVKFASASGSVLWAATYDDATWDDGATDLELDASGNVYMAGTVWNGADYDYATVKLNGGTGAKMWPSSGGNFRNGAMIFDGGQGGSDAAVGLGFDNAGSFYVGGTSRGAGSGADFVVVKYAISGGLADFYMNTTVSRGGNTNVVGTVVLSAPAPGGGATVALSSNSPATVVPSSVTVAAGATTATFPVTVINNGYTFIETDVTATYGSSLVWHLQVRPNNKSEFVSQTAPTSLAPGQTAVVTVVFKNTGGTTWVEPTYFYRLASVNPSHNTIWGINRLKLSPLSQNVLPGQNGVFSGTITAPTTPGTYNFQWRMVQDGIEGFGPNGPAINLVVATAGDNAELVSKSVPTTFNAGNDFIAQMTMRNTGTTTWTNAAGYKLVTANPLNNVTWIANRADLASAASVAPGSTYTFNRMSTAPVNPGTYSYDWVMYKDGGGQFGQVVSSSINVVNGPYNAEFVSVTGVPTRTVELKNFTAVITVKNRGTKAWTSADQIVLRSMSPPMNVNWGVAEVPLPSGVTVNPGASYSFVYTFRAPAHAGRYYFHWRLGRAGMFSFGGLSDPINVRVDPGTVLD